ncbi:MAG TPA: class I SAM-dependent methyltransferase [Acidimicrobiales bacterium]
MTALVSDAGERIDLAVGRWRTEPGAAERALLARVPDPVLDVGCGPGRIVAALAAAGRVALGVDPSPAAIHEATRRRAPALRRSVFDPLPGERRWGTVLLLDGNVGIGGDPVALLGRAAALLRPGGVVVAEVEPPGRPTRRLTVRVESPGGTGPWFPWARVSADAFAGLAARAGLRPGRVEIGADAGGHRWFARAVRP